MGYTLIEVLITMAILTTLTATLVSNFLDTSQKRADVVVSEMWMISKAVQAYDTQVGAFPASSSSTLCADAIGVLTNNGLLAGISTTSSPWSASSKYVTNCATGENLMTLSINTNTEWAKYIAKALPATSINGTTTTLNIPKLAHSVVLNNSLFLNSAVTSTLDQEYNNTVNSPSGTYVAKGALDMNSFSLLNPSPSLKGDIDNQPIVISSIATTAAPANATELIRIVDGIIAFDTSISDTNMVFAVTASNTYRYARIEAIAHIAGSYTFILNGTRVGAIFNTGRASRTLAVNGVTKTLILNLAKGEIITLRVYQYTGNGVNTGANLQVKEPGQSNFTVVGESSVFVILGNQPKINTAYSYFAIWAEDTAAISTAENFGFQWAFGEGQRTFNNGLVMPFEVELIALGVSLNSLATTTLVTNSFAEVEAYRNHKRVSGVDIGGTSRTVRINLTQGTSTDNREIVSFEDSPITYSAGDFLSFRTIGNSGVPASPNSEGAIVVAWFRTRLQ